jgi:hypothetical protein
MSQKPEIGKTIQQLGCLITQGGCLLMVLFVIGMFLWGLIFGQKATP